MSDSEAETLDMDVDQTNEEYIATQYDWHKRKWLKAENKIITCNLMIHESKDRWQTLIEMQCEMERNLVMEREFTEEEMDELDQCTHFKNIEIAKLVHYRKELKEQKELRNYHKLEMMHYKMLKDEWSCCESDDKRIYYKINE